MKPSLRDYLTIAAALLAILLCGYGIGFLVGEHTTQRRLGGDLDEMQSQPAGWERTTLERLSADLDLSPEQQAKIRTEIRAAADTINAARERAIHDYRQALFDLHDNIQPHLTDKQRERVSESQRRLKEVLDKESPVPDPVPRRE